MHIRKHEKERVQKVRTHLMTNAHSVSQWSDEHNKSSYRAWRHMPFGSVIKMFRWCFPNVRMGPVAGLCGGIELRGSNTSLHEHAQFYHWLSRFIDLPRAVPQRMQVDGMTKGTINLDLRDKKQHDG